jgi:chloramphenicol 3-O-phosphotransferase
VSGTYTQAAGTLSLGEDLSAPEVLIKPGATLGASNATIAGSLVNDGTAMLAGSASTREEIHHRGDRAADRRPGWISFRWLRQAGGQG